ncbi:hypothetical protein [Cellulophaga sp. BC115SP]|uniref:hypothetical protein n=1 Tax=Cellulophaga sp. BC115SP TaxID=2683263 RepID=UPI001412B4E7|nr:hypothetical protein [Cellulophaga sp. BC115SP]NBB30039.1 hypothetical protein [Cellulophaga sp. BC115SP]
MKKITVSAAVMMSLLTVGISQHSVAKIVETQKNTVGDEPSMAFLRKLQGKYPFDVKLFNSQSLTTRLKKLLGNRYQFMVSTWAVEVPIEVKNNLFVANGCEQHNCGATNFIIVYDFTKNNLSAGIREGDKVNTYSEDGSNSPRVMQWVNNY